jgi:hypothetical protein
LFEKRIEHLKHENTGNPRKSLKNSPVTKFEQKFELPIRYTLLSKTSSIKIAENCRKIGDDHNLAENSDSPLNFPHTQCSSKSLGQFVFNTSLTFSEILNA